MEVALFVLGLSAIIAGIAFIIYAFKENDSFWDVTPSLIGGLSLIVLGVFAWIAIAKIGKNEFSTSEFTVKKEIRVESINNIIQKSDTVYVFKKIK